MGLLDSIAASLSGGTPPFVAPQGGDISQISQPTGGQIPQSGANNAAMNPQPPQQPQPQQMGPQLTGVKGYLSNIFYQMGEAAKAHLGMKTDQEVQLEQQRLNIAKQQADANTFEKQSEAQWRQQQTAQNAQGPVIDQREADSLSVPLGTMLSPAQKFAIYKSKADMAGKTNIAQIGANARLGAAQIQALSRMSQTSMKAAYMPDGTLGVGLYDKAGNFRGYADNAVVPAEYLEKIRHGQEFKVDADGNLQAIPTTSTSAPLVPPSPANQPNNKLIQSPEPPNPSNLKSILTKGAAQAGQAAITPSAAKAALQNGAQAKPVTNAKPVMSGNHPFKAPSAADTGFAFDPATQENYLTTRAEAANKGYQNFNKASSAQVENVRQLNNRLADVQQKIERYQGAANQPLSAGDKYAISKLMSDQHFEAAFKPFGVGVTIPTGFITELDRAAQANGLSDAGRNKLISYMNAREAMVGYQRVLSGSGRGNEKQMEMLLQTLPSPITDAAFANEGFKQFRENLRIAGQGLPKIPGVQSASDIENRNSNGEPPRPQNVPQNYVYKVNGPKGTGWYRP